VVILFLDISFLVFLHLTETNMPEEKDVSFALLNRHGITKTGLFVHGLILVHPLQEFLHKCTEKYVYIKVRKVAISCCPSVDVLATNFNAPFLIPLIVDCRMNKFREAITLMSSFLEMLHSSH
jgi:hypothetical protein